MLLPVIFCFVSIYVLLPTLQKALVFSTILGSIVTTNNTKDIDAFSFLF
jgi:hypothetical protein